MPDTTAVVAFDLELREASDPAEFTGRAVPYGVQAQTPEGREEFAPGAFDPAQAVGVPLYYGHSHRDGGMPVGVVTGAEGRDDGLYVTGRLSDTAQGRDVAALLRDGALRGLSVGFVATATRAAAGAMVRTAARLVEVSVTPTPAYADAQVLAVREEESPMPDTVAVETTATAVADTEARDAIAEVRSAVADLTARYAGPSDPAAAYRDLADYAAAVWRGDAPNDILVRAGLADQVTTDNAGLFPPRWVAQVQRIIDFGRPAITACGTVSAGDSGLDFNWPTFAGDLATLVAEQATEKTDITSVKVSFGKQHATLKVYAGGSDVSYPLLDRSDPAYLGLYMEVMAAGYALTTDKDFGAALVTAGTPQLGYDIAADTTGDKLAAELFKASVAVETATGAPATFVLVASDVFLKLGSMSKLVAPKYATQNVPGVAQASTLAVDVNGLPVIHDRNLAAGTVLVTNAQAAKWIEAGPKVVNAEDVAKLGRNYAIYGYGAAAVYIPKGIIKISKT